MSHSLSEGSPLQRWYVAGIAGGSWGAIALKRLVSQGIESYLPFVTLDGRREAMFPGYVLVTLDLDERPQQVRGVNGTPGISRLLPKHSERPLPLRVGFVERLQELIVSGKWRHRFEDELVERYAPGQMVRVNDGLYSGHSAPFDRYEGGRVVLLMTVLGKRTEVPVLEQLTEPCSRVTRLDRGAAASQAA